MTEIEISKGHIYFPDNILGYSPEGDYIRVNFNGTYVHFPFSVIVRLYEGYKHHFENSLKRDDFDEFVTNLLSIKKEK